MKSLPRLFVIVLAAVSLLVPTSCGCGGGGGGGNPFPSIVSTSPASNVAEVQIAAAQLVVSALFDRDMDAATINASTFLLQTSGGAVTGTVSYSNRKASFVPSADLQKITDYTAKITAGVMDKSGKALPADYAWTFTTEDRRWLSPQQVDGESLSAEPPSLDLLSGGEARAVWAQGYGLTGGIFNFFSVGMNPITKVWSNAAVLGTGINTPVHEARIAADGNNRAFLAWEQQTGTAQGAVYARIYDGNSISFGAPARLDNAPEPVTEGPEIAGGFGGFVFVVWVQPGAVAGNDEVRANWFNPFLGPGAWTGAQTLDNLSLTASDLRVAASGSDHAVVAWTQGGNLYTNLFDIGAGGWQGVQSMEADSDPVLEVAVSMDGFGNAVLLWAQSDGTATRVRSRFFDPVNGWGSQQIRDSGTGSAGGILRLARNSIGSFLATWLEFDGSNFALWGSLYTILGGGWGAPTKIADGPAGTLAVGQVATALSSTDLGLVIWSPLFSATDSQTEAYRYVPGKGWAKTANPLHAPGVESLAGNCAFDAFDRAVAIYVEQVAGDANIYVNRFE